jgi:hypothetical protein
MTPIQSALFAPLVTLCAWTMLMWLWMYATRIPAIRAARMKLEPGAVRGEQMATLPPSVRWKADNYNHLFEQPTIFYPLLIVLALLGDASAFTLALAWAYVGLRVAHSLWQSLSNIIEVRFALFVLSSLCVFGLIGRALALSFAVAL